MLQFAERSDQQFDSGFIFNLAIFVVLEDNSCMLYSWEGLYDEVDRRGHFEGVEEGSFSGLQSDGVYSF